MNVEALNGLTRVRWGARATLALGVIASGAANILHAQPDPISRAISAWPPLALLFAVELISRVPVHRPWMAGIRLSAASLLAGIAGWVSYWHMAAVAANYGETGSSAYLLPLTVDGLVVVASISLVELNARIRAHTETGPVTDPRTHTLPGTDLVVAQPDSSSNGRRETSGMIGTVSR
ncbi:MAG TPA: DUF2637 domain-containing protein [Candidatus Limnocylindrales bacterium]|nr:DUF2637 domain-containing protein [Candidatus Limnocylindrales bacterium]